MTLSERSRTPAHRAPWILVAGLLAVAVSGAALGLAHGASPGREPAAQAPASPGRAAARSAVPASTAALPTDAPGELGAPAGVLPGRGAALGPADGVLPSGATAFDTRLPGVARLDQALLGALQRATTDAQHDGVHIDVDSGWRSAGYQEQLLRQAVSRYGSEAEAARWVATPTTSAHVTGEAVDVGPAGPAAWLSAHGAAYGLCQIYRNEPWHFELRADAATRGCPPMYADPTQDPRMHP